MDHFGIGAALEGAARIYFSSARASGRTTSLLESLKSGDRVVFPTQQSASYMAFKCRERGLEVECVVVPPAHPESLFERAIPRGRTLFDHTWVEESYLLALQRCRVDIDHWQRETSGYGTAHIETRHAAQEIAKWRK
jgi:hypothetical protein